ncbi:mitochondrial glyco protein [Rhizoclosmatium globosum]|uniref:Mitochondrial glyco protein n=1 Tax=Rhizoclosmatium globosum TaxID=329046 RepID=A0A1Y2C422_9FUNG|nr:mitochondrial glyco protein [Rhizoclosmatium globosum]|eukprot:ORY41055.1 mitochondrial glyco protein [Rhizoclosmatium globosum]
MFNLCSDVAFSITNCFFPFCTGDRDLAHKLESELKFEKENAETGVPSFIQAFNNRGVFKIEDKVGEKEVTLVRNFGNEKISVIFSTDAIADKAEFDDTESDQDEQFAVNVTIVIEKKAATDNGALEILATVQDNAFFVDSVRFNPSSTIMTAQNAEADWQRNGSYGGPVFQDLDEGLQDQFHDFLRERGFDEALAEFVPQYIDFKEQNEYTEWLKRVGEWVAK